MKVNKRSFRKIISVLIGILFLMQLGFYFVDGKIHEVVGVILLVLVVVHNISYLGWYKNIGKGKYTKKRILTTSVVVLLLIDFVAIAVSSILISTYVFPNVGGTYAAAARQVHLYAVMAGLVLIVAHVGIHVYYASRTTKKAKLITGTAVVMVGAIAFGVFGFPYMERHFKKVHVDAIQAIQGEKVSFGNKKVLAVYFTRLGNTDFESNVDAVSGASLMIDDTAKDKQNVLVGNSEMLAKMVQDAVGGDIYAIQTEEKYPSTYNGTVKVAKEELDHQTHPKLINKIENVEQYDTVFLVYPLWWSTIPMPVASFLEDNDLSGKTLIPVVTQGSNGVANSIKDIKKLTKATVEEDAISIYCSDITTSRADITDWLKRLK